MWQSNLISRHEYFFPFSWRVQNHKLRALSFQEIEIENIFLKHLDTWVEVNHSINTPQHYNERVYFYYPVQEILYPNDTNTLLRVLIKKDSGEDDFLLLESLTGEYKLSLSNIQLKLYKTGVAILSFMLENNSVDTTEAVITINALSKTVYPYRLPLSEIQKDFFPKKITLNIGGKVICEDFSKDYLQKEYQVNQFLLGLLGDKFTTYEKTDLLAVHIRPLMNNRMFVLCTYYNKTLLNRIKEGQIDELELNKFLYFSSKEKGGIQDRIELPHSIYSISRFSMIAISNCAEKIYSYNQLITLALIQRTTILHFSNQVAYISSLDKKELIYAIRQMYEIYVQFTTRVYFEEVTVDIEGTRIYDSLISQAQIQKELKQLDFEMQEIHEYAMLIEKYQSRNKMDFLTIVGTALVIPTFVTGFFGMNILQEEFMGWWHSKKVALWFNSYVMLPVLAVIIFYTWEARGGKSIRVRRIIMLAVLLGSLLISILYGCGIDKV